MSFITIEPFSILQVHNNYFKNKFSIQFKQINSNWKICICNANSFNDYIYFKDIDLVIFYDEIINLQYGIDDENITSIIHSILSKKSIDIIKMNILIK